MGPDPSCGALAHPRIGTVSAFIGFFSNAQQK